MAMNVTELYEVDDLYDKETGLMRVTVQYNVSGQLDEHEHIATPNLALPGGIPSMITRPTVRVQGESLPIQTLELYDVHREIPSRFGPDRGKVQVTYEGHEYGVMTWNIDLGTGPREIQAGVQLQDSEGANIALEPVGPNEKSRLTIESPQQMIIVTQNWTGIQYPETARHGKLLDFLDLISALSGQVNEYLWAPGFWGEAFPEGHWLYLGAESIRHRDTTWTFEHKFVTNRVNYSATSDFARMHIYRWYDSKEKPKTETIGGVAGEGATDVDFSDTANEVQIYYIAGNDASGRTFGDLDL